MIDESVKLRFFDKIDKVSSGCWEWSASIRSGYGALKVNGKVLGTHRLSWMIHNGEIPKGLYVCHKCDNRKCVNPDHLFLGTHSINMKDAFDKGRLKMPHNNKFMLHNYPLNTNVSKEKAIEVKRSVEKRGKKTLKTISEEFKVPYQYVRDISCGRILKHY